MGGFINQGSTLNGSVRGLGARVPLSSMQELSIPKPENYLYSSLGYY